MVRLLCPERCTGNTFVLGGGEFRDMFLFCSSCVWLQTLAEAWEGVDLGVCAFSEGLVPSGGVYVVLGCSSSSFLFLFFPPLRSSLLGPAGC